MQTVDWAAEFVALVGATRARAWSAFRYVRCTDTRLDKVAEVVAMAWVRWHSLIDRGEDPRPVAGAIAGYSISAVRAGFTLGTHKTTTDVLVPAAQRCHRFRVVRLTVNCSRKTNVSCRELIDPAAANPAELAAARVDWDEWSQSLPPVQRCACGYFVEGYTNHETARTMRIGTDRVKRARRKLKNSWRSYCQVEE